MIARSASDLAPLLCAAIVILVVGVFDDALELRGRQKLAGQLLAVAILMVALATVALVGIRLLGRFIG